MSTAITPLAPIPPWVLDPSTRWLTVGDASRVWNKHRNTIREWCESGFFASINVPTYRDPHGRWYVRAIM